jgi:hypothetical protein
MRYEKKVLVLSSVLAALLVIWAAGLIFSPERVAARSESARLIAGKASDVASISLQGPAPAPAKGAAPAAPASPPSVELSKSGSSWVLLDGSAKFPVESSRVTSFLDALGSVSRLRVVARSKDSWAGFQLDDAHAKHALLKDASGKVLADLYVGSYGPTGSEIYLRRGSSDLSYTADSSVSSYLDPNRGSWLDLKVLGGLKEGDVQSLAIKSSIVLDSKTKAKLDLDYSLRRDGQGWKAGAAQVDAESVAALVRSVIALRGEDYVVAPPSEAFAKIDARLALELGTGKSTVVEVGAMAPDNRFYARIAGEGPVFTLSSFSLKSVLKSLSDLAKK